jgi:hypothetical protein
MKTSEVKFKSIVEFMPGGRQGSRKQVIRDLVVKFPGTSPGNKSAGLALGFNNIYINFQDNNKYWYSWQVKLK